MALHCRANSLISTNTVVPNPATRRAIADIYNEPPFDCLAPNNH
jgi:hypothetical protein